MCPASESIIGVAGAKSRGGQGGRVGMRLVPASCRKASLPPLVAAVQASASRQQACLPRPQKAAAAVASARGPSRPPHPCPSALMCLFAHNPTGVCGGLWPGVCGKDSARAVQGRAPCPFAWSVHGWVGVLGLALVATRQGGCVGWWGGGVDGWRAGVGLALLRLSSTPLHSSSLPLWCVCTRHAPRWTPRACPPDHQRGVLRASQASHGHARPPAEGQHKEPLRLLPHPPSLLFFHPPPQVTHQPTHHPTPHRV